MPLNEKELLLPEETAESSETVDAETVDMEEPVEVYETSAEILLDAGRETHPKRKREMNDFVRIGGSLLLICAVVAMVVSFVNAVTADIIAEAAEREKQAAVMRIFGEDAVMNEIDPLAGTNAVYAVADAGYCVNLESNGFGGAISMMVGVGTDGRLIGVEIVSHAETPGFGAKADDPAYLGQYTGHGSRLALGAEIDALAGATISSKAVLAGVNAATAALVEAGLVEEYLTPVVEEEEFDPFGEWDDYGEWDEWMEDVDGGEYE